MAVMTRGISMRIILGFTILLSLAGCGTAPVGDFTLEVIQSDAPSKKFDADLYSVVLAYNLPAKGRELGPNVEIPIQWRDFLEASLDESKFFDTASALSADVIMTINLVKLPIAGGAMQTELAATYSIVDRGTENELFFSNIRSKSDIPFSYAFNGQTRMQESVKRAITDNVSGFLNDFRNFIQTRP